MYVCVHACAHACVCGGGGEGERANQVCAAVLERVSECKSEQARDLKAKAVDCVCVCVCVCACACVCFTQKALCKLILLQAP